MALVLLEAQVWKDPIQYVLDRSVLEIRFGHSAVSAGHFIESAGWKRNRFLQKTCLFFHQKFIGDEMIYTHTHTNTRPPGNLFFCFWTEIPAKARRKVRGASSSSETKFAWEKTKGDMLSPKLPSFWHFYSETVESKWRKSRGRGGTRFSWDRWHADQSCCSSRRESKIKEDKVCAHSRMFVFRGLLFGWADLRHMPKALASCSFILFFWPVTNCCLHFKG